MVVINNFGTGKQTATTQECMSTWHDGGDVGVVRLLVNWGGCGGVGSGSVLFIQQTLWLLRYSILRGGRGSLVSCQFLLPIVSKIVGYDSCWLICCSCTTLLGVSLLLVVCYSLTPGASDRRWSCRQAQISCEVFCSGCPGCWLSNQPSSSIFAVLSVVSGGLGRVRHRRPAPLIVSNLCIPGQACGLSSYQIANLPSASEHNIPQTVLRTAEPASI